MVNDILVYILELKSFIITFLVVVIILGIYLNYKFKRINFDVKKIKKYSLFFLSSNLSIISLSAALMSYIFIIWYLLILPKFHIMYLVLLFGLNLIFNLFIGKYINIITDFINRLFQYILLVLIGYLIGYLYDIRIVWYVVIMVILLTVFILINSTYLLLKNINDILIKDVKRNEKKSH
ncbi:MAG: hypothetical protein PHX04_03145 [Bacilli bacterium]|nr:hypothetical protein [Bacilli bacterium]